MAQTFSRTLRALGRDGPRGGFWLLGGAGLVVAWVGWLAGSAVPVCETTEVARLEVTGAAHPITADVGGRVAEVRLVLGREVQAGEVLVVLDTEAEDRALQEHHVRRKSLESRLAALRKEIQAEQEALAAQEKARTAAQVEARAQVAEAEVRAVQAERQAESSERVYEGGAGSADVARNDRAEATARRANVRALRAAADRQNTDRLVLETERRTRLAKLERETVELEGELAAETAAVGRLEHDLARRQVRAPVGGKVGEVAAVRVGTVVRPAERLGAVVPPGERRAVALFPVAAAGRLRPGQPARLKLDGFPWTQYGALAATVAEVGTEATEGRVRVELTLSADPEARVPIEHGLTGSAEVEVERVSPAALLLRAAGQALAPRTDPPKRSGGE